MIDFAGLFGSEQAIFRTFFKSFAVIGSALYLVYAIVLVRQTSVMLRALEEGYGGIIRAISFAQLLVAALLIILALTIL